MLEVVIGAYYCIIHKKYRFVHSLLKKREILYIQNNIILRKDDIK